MYILFKVFAKYFTGACVSGTGADAEPGVEGGRGGGGGGGGGHFGVRETLQTVGHVGSSPGNFRNLEALRWHLLHFTVP